MASPTALHSKATNSWGSPENLIEMGRELLDGRIDLDPASSLEFNKLVRAAQIYTIVDNGLVQVWAGNAFVNPPGGLIREFWQKLMDSVAEGLVPKAFWVGFSVEQLCLLADMPFYPADFSTCILRKRLAFNTEALAPGGSPSHGNYVTAIGCDRAVFDRLFLPLGKVIHGPLSLEMS